MIDCHVFEWCLTLLERAKEVGARQGSLNVFLILSVIQGKRLFWVTPYRCRLWDERILLCDTYILVWSFTQCLPLYMHVQAILRAKVWFQLVDHHLYIWDCSAWTLCYFGCTTLLCAQENQLFWTYSLCDSLPAGRWQEKSKSTERSSTTDL